jgi:hypothetical protein
MFTEDYIKEIRRKLNNEIGDTNKQQYLGLPAYVVMMLLLFIAEAILRQLDGGVPDAKYIGQILIIGAVGVSANSAVLMKRAGIYLGLLDLYERNELKEGYQLTHWQLWFPRQWLLTKIMVPLSGSLIAFPFLIAFWPLGFRPWEYLGWVWHVIFGILALAGFLMVILPPQLEARAIAQARKVGLEQSPVLQES